MRILGVDVGGTFTDAVLVEAEAAHREGADARPQEESVVAAARAVCRGGPQSTFHHGTTVATNALLERRGARTAFVATEGFEHLLHLRRQDRAHLYRLGVDHPEPLVPLERCVGVRERMGPQESSCRSTSPRCRHSTPRQSPSACSSHSGPGTRARGLDELRRRHPGAHVVASHEVAPEIREYERASTTVVDAYLGPVLGGYLEALGGVLAVGLPEPLVMRSSGGVVTIDEAAAHPVVILVSGPAAGVIGAEQVARSPGSETRSHSTWAARRPTCA